MTMQGFFIEIGLYVCRFKYRNLHWQASHLVKFPLQVLDITRNPPQVLLWNNSTMFLGTTVECCIWDDGISYHVFWEPGHIPSGVVKQGGQQCYTLSIESIPENDTHFRCVFQDNMNKAVESGVRVDVVQVKDIFCSDDGDNMWKATKVGREAEILCPNGKKGRITRSCLRNGQWGIPKTTCMDARLLSVLDQAERLRGGLGLPEQEISEMIARLRNHITSIQTFDAGDIITVVDTIKTLSLTATDNNVQFNSTTMADFVAVFSLVLDYDSETTWITARIEHPFIGSNFMQSVENITKLFETNWNNYTLVQPNVQLSVVVLSPSSLTSYNKTFDTTPTVEVSMKNIDFPDHMDINKVTVTNMVLRNLAKILPMNFGDSIEGYWHNVESHIVMNTIMMSNQSLRQVNVDMVFVHGKVHNRTDAQCVFWDYSLFEGVGGWSTDGCRTFRQDSYTVCRCTHLTAFSVLMSLGVLTDDYLETLSEIGVILSIICLTISIIIYIAEWKSVVKNDISFFRQTAMINISLSLLIGDTWFLSSTFMEESHTNKLCISAAFFQHLFYLATFFWMLVHGLILFHQLVFVFHQLIKSIVIPAMVAIGYVCPLVIASVTISIDYPKAAYIKEGACFINGDNGAIFAFSGPVLLIVFVNFFIIGVVIWKLLRPSVSEGQQEDRKALVAKALIILTSVFGITWILGTATLIEEAHEFFHYAFTVLNSLQGVFILLFVCLLDKKVTGALSKRFQNLKTLNSSMTCCGENSYNMDSSNEPESVETYNAIEDS
ncbi:adhesion G-protein coupled receptor F3-like [Mixophyes fleayi]|uniref:adhesion G-protein coupled receptor F3-like n=1 Tax=Mixophyes fleayi TaxID=3061075 RepID=UPI003F4DA502